MKIPLIVLLLTSLWSGCAMATIDTSMVAQQAGPAPENPETTIKAYLNEVLRDPDSAKVEILVPPFQAYTREAPAAGGGLRQIGWGVVFRVNAKNGFGGYVGWHEKRVLIRNNVVVDEFSSNPFFKEPWFKETVSPDVAANKPTESGVAAK